MKKIKVCVVLFCLLCIAVTAAGGGRAEAAPEDEQLRVAVITPGPIGDRSYIDSMHAGYLRVRDELPVSVRLVQPQGVHEHESSLRGVANQNFDLIITMAVEEDLIFSVARDYPDIKFGLIDLVPTQPLLPNIASRVVEVNEASYLVGVVAGMMTKTNIIGCVAGLDIPVFNESFIGPFEQGAQAVNPEVTVLRSYTGSFDDPTQGKEYALSQYENNADIIFHAAGKTGEGVFSAAQETGNFAIGVDSNQDWIAPGSIIVSQLKRVDNGVFEYVQEMLDGEFNSELIVTSIAEGGAGISWDVGSTYFQDHGPSDMVDMLPQVKDMVEKHRQKIIEGEITVMGSYFQ